MPPLSAPLSPLSFVVQAHALEAGLRVRDGAAHVRVRPGVYAIREEWDRLRSWERYAARVHAFHLRHPDAVLAFESAAVALGLPIFGEPRDIHVYDPDRASSRRFGDVCVHTSGEQKALVARGGVLLTSLATTAVDLMRVLPPAFGLAVADAAVSPSRTDAASIELLREVARAQPRGRGSARFALLLPMIDPRAESAGETVSRATAIWLGYAEPETQVEFIAEGVRDRADFFWRRASVIGESDGYGKYTGTDVVARVVDEKRREDRLRRQVRAFTRWDWAAAMRVTPLDERLHRAGIAHLRAPQRALLSTLRHHPRSLPATRNHFSDGKPRSA
ncbi:hypothetical protein QNO21_01800 [Microbacterium sp. zg-Y818]|uniref:hypothetical protein n=1 Tax=unclassified Microbacterium TaxID=2609290 RepID=UPI00214BE6C8|nr:MULTISPECIES: hypothetical protein [unclassified Microbacterium]MCR2802254.1 hypothetical protein [Microbacterium sp. zg.Y818]WIM22797.1 hypothetical protein QNO21_01800 [Microbacterium sp. zg-Y818]